MKINDYEKEHLNKLRAGLAECTALLKCNGDFPLEMPGKTILAMFAPAGRFFTINLCFSGAPR